ncbi:hypothetical protein BCR34DRAFT_600243 [Clohesyomyces aquaticus]|uniref:Mid2 domain-containing protein n=1 Tax=Clohesyomyces aquaticus TaxID=1231657 RepID=A0A1Y1ZSF9_9PLEO|nr:hypothetical protein BCR34DRAFT_600243 [Clohesyomyces aquaticus]
MRLLQNPVVLLTTTLLHTASAICYYPNGKQADVGDIPCSSTGDSTCCAKGYACLSNNLCKATIAFGIGLPVTTYARGSCTDQSWNATECLDFCRQNTNSGGSLRKCDTYDEDVYYCMNADTDKFTPEQNCVNKSVVHTLAPTPFKILTTIGVDAKSTSGPVATSTTTTQPSSTPSTSPASKPHDYSVAIGAGVGVPLGILSVGLLAFLFLRFRRNKNAHQGYVAHDIPNMPYTETAKHYAETEMASPPAELPDRGAQELGTHNGRS